MKTDHLPHLTPPTLSPTRRIQQRGASLFGVLLVVAALLGGLWYAGYLEFEPHPTQSVSSHQSLSDETFADMTRVVNGVAMLPMREAFEALDAQVHYDAKRDVAVAEVPGSTVTLRPGAHAAGEALPERALRCREGRAAPRPGAGRGPDRRPGGPVGERPRAHTQGGLPAGDRRGDGHREPPLAPRPLAGGRPERREPRGGGALVVGSTGIEPVTPRV